MPTSSELQLLITAKDMASAGIHALAGALVGELGSALAEVARAAAEDEASTARLAQAVDNAGASYEDYQALLEDQIKLGQSLAFTDDETRGALSNLVAQVKDVPKALELESLAMEVARGRHIDLATAAELVGKVAGGNTAILSRYGIEIKGVVTPTTALAELQKRYANQAEDYGASTAGAIDRIKDSIAEWREGIGAAIGPAGVFLALLPQMSIGMDALAGAATALDLALAPVLIAIAAVAGALAVGGAVGVVGGNLVSGRDAFDFSGIIPGLGEGGAAPADNAAIPNAGAPLYDIYGNQYGTVPGYAKGGVVPGPLGMPRLAMVHGGETVTPAGRSGNGGDIHLHFDGANFYGTDDFEQKVASAVKRVKQNGGFRGVLA